MIENTSDSTCQQSLTASSGMRNVEPTAVTARTKVEIGGAVYWIQIRPSPAGADKILVEIISTSPAGPPAIEGALTVPAAAIPTLAPVLQILASTVALHTATADLPVQALSMPLKKRRSRGNAAAPRSHQPWPPEDDQQLADTWLAEDAQSASEELVGRLASEFRRTPVAIRSRLEKLNLDPDRPGYGKLTVSATGAHTEVGGDSSAESGTQGHSTELYTSPQPTPTSGPTSITSVPD
jgi:hypothetical protein